MLVRLAGDCAFCSHTPQRQARSFPLVTSLASESSLFSGDLVLSLETSFVIGDLGDDLGRVLVPEGEVILIVYVQALL